MSDYSIISLKDMVEELGESVTKELLSSFSSHKNKDVEHFIRNNAIEFANKNIAPTFLVYVSYEGEQVLCGYFTITMKMISVYESAVSKRTFERIKKFGTYDSDHCRCEIPAPLIAQLSKNFTNDYNKHINGKKLLELACDTVRRSQEIVGGKIVYLECEDKDKLNKFYNNNGFREFAKRNLDKEESETIKGKYLIQMLKYLN